MRFEDPKTIEDGVLFLYFFSKIGEENFLNRIQEQKLYFLMQFKAKSDNGIMTRVRFIRDKFGPFAPHVKNLDESFEAWNYLLVTPERYYDRDQRKMQLSPKGWEIADELKDLFSQQRFFFKYIDAVLAENRKVDAWSQQPQSIQYSYSLLRPNLPVRRGWDLRKDVYSLQVNGIDIENWPMRHEIPTLPSVSEWEWKVPQDWNYTVRFILFPGNLEMMAKMCQENSMEPSVPYRWS